MDASTPQSRFRRPNGLRAGVVIGLAVALVGAAVGTVTGAVAVTPFQQVLVVNPPANPVQVAGTVNVGNTPANQNVTVTNLPATQPVSGTVNVGNLPATQPVSGTVNVGNLPTTQLATKAYYDRRYVDAETAATFDFGRTINVTKVIVVNDDDDDLYITMTTAGSQLVVLKAGNGGGTWDFTMPVPATSIGLACLNFVLDCDVTVSVLGS